MSTSTAILGPGGHSDPGPQHVRPHCWKEIACTILVEARFRNPDVDRLLNSSFKLPVVNCQNLHIIQTHSMVRPMHKYMLWHLTPHTALPPMFRELSLKWVLKMNLLRARVRPPPRVTRLPLKLKPLHVVPQNHHGANSTWEKRQRRLKALSFKFSLILWYLVDKLDSDVHTRIDE